MNYWVFLFVFLLVVCSCFYWSISKGKLLQNRTAVRSIATLLCLVLITIMTVGNLVNYNLIPDFANINLVKGVGNIGWSVIIGLVVVVVFLFSVVTFILEKIFPRHPMLRKE